MGAALAIGVGAQGCVAYSFTAHFPTVPGDLIGQPTIVGESASSAEFCNVSQTSQGRLGAAVALLVVPDRAADPDLLQTPVERQVIGSCPMDPGLSPGSPGAIARFGASFTEGTLDPAILQAISGSSVSSPGLFGQAMLGADVRDCRDALSDYRGCGQELLVGSPMTDGGAVHWFEHRYTGSAWTLVHGGDLPSPGTPLTGWTFGNAIAAPVDALTPFAKAPWVAVANSGGGRVDVYEVDPASSAPFSILSPGLSPHGGFSGNFARALAVGDFNGDGEPDLAIGSPRDTTGGGLHGRVDIYRFDPSAGAGVNPFAGQHQVTLTRADFTSVGANSLASSVTTPDEFGFALATGRLVLDGAGDTLVIGVPRGDDGEGRVCQVAFSSTWSLVARNCVVKHSNSVVGDRYGHAVAVGNYVNADSKGNFDTEWALHPEIAVGVPNGEQRDGSATTGGFVQILLTDDEGIANQTTPLDVFPASHNNADAVGRALATGYVQDTGWEDLVIGDPGRGRVLLTRGDDFAPCDDRVYSTWDVAKPGGGTGRVRVWLPAEVGAPTHVTFVDDFPFAIHENGDPSDPACSFQDGDGTWHNSPHQIPAGTVIPLSGTYACGGAAQQVFAGTSADPILAAIVAADDPTDVRIKAGEELDVTLRWNHNGSPGTRSAHTLDLTFDIAPLDFGAFGADSSCRVTAQPFVGSNAERVIE
jgi:hypothetical protein